MEGTFHYILIMKKLFTKKILFTITIFLVIILTVDVLLEKNLFHYFSLGNDRDPHKTCQQKKIIWDKTVYLIDHNPSGGKLVLKIENRNRKFWSEMLDAVQSPEEEFKTCTKSIVKFPKVIENSPNTPSEIKERSKGLELNIGIQEPFRYTPIADLIFNIYLFSNRFTNESYNLDVAVTNIAENIFLIQESDTSWRLSVKSLPEDQNLPFHYDLVRVNDEEVIPNKTIEFISYDNGKTWSQSK